MPAIEKKPTIIKGYGPGVVSSDMKSHANDSLVVKKVKEATETIQRVGLPGQKKK